MATKKKAVKKKKEKFNFFKVYVNGKVIAHFDSEKEAKALAGVKGGEVVGRVL